MSKEQVIYNNVIVGNVKGFTKDSNDPADLKVERLVEKAIAKVGNLTWVGDENLPYDFKEDKSDAKTSSVSKSVSISFQGTITSTDAKEGALRCVISNEYSPKGIDYFYIPIKEVKKLQTKVGGKKNIYAKKKISYNYSPKKDSYGKLELFRCKNFKEMCNKNG